MEVLVLWFSVICQAFGVEFCWANPPKGSLAHLLEVGGWFTNPSEKYGRQNGFIFPKFSGWKWRNIWVATTFFYFFVWFIGFCWLPLLWKIHVRAEHEKRAANVHKKFAKFRPSGSAFALQSNFFWTKNKLTNHHWVMIRDWVSTNCCTLIIWSASCAWGMKII